MSTLDARFVMSRTTKFAVIDATRAADTAAPAPGPPGHLFILLADITRLACDAWIGVAGGTLDPERCVPLPHGRATPEGGLGTATGSGVRARFARSHWLRRASRQRHADMWRLEPSDGGAWPSGEPRLYVLRDTLPIVLRAQRALQ